MFGKNTKNKKAFTKDMLPANRRESFIDVLKSHLGLLVKIGFILFLFSLPMLITIIIHNLEIMSVNQAYQSDLIQNSERINRIFQITRSRNILIIPTLVIFSLALSGSLQIIRNLIWQHPVFFWHDFKMGFKKNARDFAFVFFFLGIMHAVLQYLIRYQNLSSDPMDEWIIVVAIASAVYLIPVSFLVLTQTILYHLNFIHKIKNAILIVLRTAPKTFLFSLISLLPMTLLLIQNTIFFSIGFFTLFLIFLPIDLLAILEYNFYLLDIFINKYHHAKIYEKGIWR